MRSLRKSIIFSGCILISCYLMPDMKWKYRNDKWVENPFTLARGSIPGGPLWLKAINLVIPKWNFNGEYRHYPRCYMDGGEGPEIQDCGKKYKGELVIPLKLKFKESGIESKAIEKIAGSIKLRIKFQSSVSREKPTKEDFRGRVLIDLTLNKNLEQCGLSFVLGSLTNIDEWEIVNYDSILMYFMDLNKEGFTFILEGFIPSKETSYFGNLKVTGAELTCNWPEK